MTPRFRPQFHAMDTLHRSVYDVAKAISALVPQGGPVLCRDEMEEWSASEASLFEEALEKYGKDFTDIQQDFVSATGPLRSRQLAGPWRGSREPPVQGARQAEVSARRPGSSRALRPPCLLEFTWGLVALNQPSNSLVSLFCGP